MVRASSTQAKPGGSASAATGGAAALPKPCHTCARQITPRAKFKANFEAVKYCAASCRDQKPGKLIRWTDLKSERELKGTLGRLAREASKSGQSEEEGTKREVDLESWVEACLVDVASSSGLKAPLPTCEDVEARLLDEVKSLNLSTSDESAPPSSSSSAAKHPLSKALNAPPGLRERVRRAARRQIIFPSQTSKTGTLLLYTKGRTTPLVTLEDVSYAKGPISLKWEPRNT